MNDLLLCFRILMVSPLAEALPQVFLNQDISKPESTVSSLMIWPQFFGRFPAKKFKCLVTVSRSNI